MLFFLYEATFSRIHLEWYEKLYFYQAFTCPYKQQVWCIYYY